MDSPDHQLKWLRRQLRAARGALDEGLRQRHDQRIHASLVDQVLFRRARHIAVYLACGGEFDPAPLVRAAWRQGQSVYLPILVARDQPMLFAPHEPDAVLRPNWFGILEPVVPRERMLAPEQLDLVITPIVGFDPLGFRLGMAGGYYDRSFAFRKDDPDRSRGPWLIGVGYELQRLPVQTPRPWDVPLDGVVTEAGLQLFRPLPPI